jgi:polyphosphate kinase
VISHTLKKIPYKAPKAMKVKLPKRKIGRYKAVDYPFKYVPERF